MRNFFLLLSTFLLNFAFCIGENATADQNPCGGVFSGYQYQISSPNYPEDYPNNRDCLYILHGGEQKDCDQEFHLQFLDFQLDFSDECQKDFLKIGDANIYCGNTLGIRKFKGKNNFLKVLFHSDAEKPAKGFKILVTRLACSKSQRDSSLVSVNREANFNDKRQNFERGLTVQYSSSEEQKVHSKFGENGETDRGHKSRLDPDGNSSIVSVKLASYDGVEDEKVLPANFNSNERNFELGRTVQPSSFAEQRVNCESGQDGETDRGQKLPVYADGTRSIVSARPEAHTIFEEERSEDDGIVVSGATFQANINGKEQSSDFGSRAQQSSSARQTVHYEFAQKGQADRDERSYPVYRPEVEFSDDDDFEPGRGDQPSVRIESDERKLDDDEAAKKAHNFPLNVPKAPVENLELPVYEAHHFHDGNCGRFGGENRKDNENSGSQLIQSSSNSKANGNESRGNNQPRITSYLFLPPGAEGTSRVTIQNENSKSNFSPSVPKLTLVLLPPENADSKPFRHVTGSNVQSGSTAVNALPRIVTTVTEPPTELVLPNLDESKPFRSVVFLKNQNSETSGNERLSESHAIGPKFSSQLYEGPKAEEDLFTPSTRYGVPENTNTNSDGDNRYDPFGNSNPNTYHNSGGTNFDGSTNCDGRTGTNYPNAGYDPLAGNRPNTNFGVGNNDYPNTNFGFTPNSYPSTNYGPPSNNYPSTNTNFGVSGNYPNANGNPGTSDYPKTNFDFTPNSYPSTNYGPPANNYPNTNTYFGVSGTNGNPGTSDYPNSNTYPGANNYPNTNNYPGANYYPNTNNYPIASNYPSTNYDFSFGIRTNRYPNTNTGIGTNYYPNTDSVYTNVYTQDSQCCNTVYSSQRFLIASPGFPSLIYSSNTTECQYTIQKYSQNICQIRLNLKFFYLGSDDQFCAYGYLELDGRRICGCKTGLSIVSSFENYSTKIIAMRYLGYPRIKFNGFLIEVVQESCSNSYSRSGLNVGKSHFHERQNSPGFGKFYQRGKRSASGLNLIPASSHYDLKNATDGNSSLNGENLEDENNSKSFTVKKRGSRNTSELIPALGAETNRTEVIESSSDLDRSSNYNSKLESSLENEEQRVNSNLYEMGLENEKNSKSPRMENKRMKRDLGYSYRKPSFEFDTGRQNTATVSSSSSTNEHLFWNTCQALTFFKWAIAAKEVYLKSAQCSQSGSSRFIVPIISIFPGTGSGNNNPSANCESINVVEGTVISPLYPNSYANNINKCYRFYKAPGYCQLELAILDFDLEASTGCSKDYVSFSGQNRRYCGTSLTGSRTIFDMTRTSIAEMYFVSDSSGSGRGFRAGFSQISCQGQVNS